MKAYQWNGPGTGLVLQHVPVPQPSAREVQIQIKACHEISAQITALGKGVTEFHIGQRVGIALIGPATAIGLDYNGGYAEYAVTPAHTVVPLPENLSFEKACVAVDAVASAYHSVVKTAGVTSSMTVGVLGLGGLGSVGLRVACLLGATVYRVDIDSGKLETAKKNGAKACSTNIEDFKDVNFDVIMDFVGVKATMLAAIHALKREGVVVLVGMGDSEMTLPSGLIVMKNIEIRGSLGGRKEELPVIFDWIASGKLVPDVEEVPFDKLNDALHCLKQGKAKSRMYVRPNGS